MEKEKGEIVEAKENVFFFFSNLASLEVLQLISLVIAPSGISSLGQQTYHMKNGTMDIVRGNPFGEESFCQRLTAKGENTGFVIYAPHFIAEQARNVG